MEYPPQLNPVQAWLLGYIDSGELRDHTADSDDLAATYGRAVSDPDFADSLIAEAQLALEPDPSGPGAGRAVTGAEQYAIHEGMRALQARADEMAATAPTLAVEMREQADVLLQLLRSCNVLPSRELATRGQLHSAA
jgi:hypothetical protein